MTGQRIILAIAALWGLAGVALLAMGGHADETGRLTTAGQFLLFHAATVVALLSTALVTGWRRAAPIALMLLGSGLFAATIAFHVTTGVSSFIMLTPVGGTITMLAWLVLAVGALIEKKN